jgi:hypothetical protein
MPKYQKWFWLAALVAAWLFDFLFWSKSASLSFFIWIVVLLGAGYLLAWREGKKPHWRSILLTVIIVGFAAVMALRSETMTRMVSVLLTFAGMLLLTATFLDGFWPWYRVRDYVVEIAKVIGNGFAGAVLLATRNQKASGGEEVRAKSGWSKAWPILRGLLIALPIVAVFAVLLSSADQVFADWLKNLFDLEKIPEYLFRLFYILVFTGVLVGIYLKAIHPAKQAEKPAPNTPWMKPFLGWTESGIVLAAVNLLFIVFVVIQVRYLFGGTANIHETGYTYAEYARKGFGELVAVAVLSLGMYLVLGTVTKTTTRFSKTGFTVLSVLLMTNVLVILASSLQRLMLYENAYGFSQLRTYTHVFIYWLAALILAVVVLEIVRRRGHAAFALLVAVVGFGASLALLNVDGFIVNRNVARAAAGEELDVNYLNALSSDAVPQLLANFTDTGLPEGVHDKLGAALACRLKVTNNPASLPWQEFNLSQSRAFNLLTENAALLRGYQPPVERYNEWFVLVDGEEIPCSSYVGFD